MSHPIAGYPSYSLVIDEVTGEPRVWSEKSKLFMKPRVNSSGYNRVYLTNPAGKKVTVLFHRIVALTLIPNPEDHPTVDHINGDKLDNRVNNLRWASRSTQERNKPSSKGYTWDKANNKWKSCITIEGRSKHLGYFDTEVEARAAYVATHNLFFSEACVLE